MVLHGSYDTALGIMEASAMEPVAEADSSFIAVFPEMAEYEGAEWGYGNASEVKFFRDVSNLLTRQYLVATDQVFAVGHSAGGSMALFLQNHLPDVFRGVAAVEAGLPTQESTGNGRPTMLVWNHNDPVLAEYGGERLYEDTLSFLRRGDPTGAGPSSVEPLATSGEVVSAELLTWPARGSSPSTCVVSWTSYEPTHDWLNPTNIDGTTLDASILLWQFFKSILVAKA